MTVLKWILGLVLVGYVGVVALMYVLQRSLQYVPETIRTSPAAAGLAGVDELTLDTADGERVIVWQAPPRDGRPVCCISTATADRCGCAPTASGR